MALYAEVILDNPSPDIDKIFDYEIPFELINLVYTGIRVKVPFGYKNNIVMGYCIDIKNTTNVEESKIKFVTTVVSNEPVFDFKMLELAKWMKKRYFTSLSQCLKVITPPDANLRNHNKTAFLNVDLKTAEKEYEKLKSKRKAQAAVIEYIIKNGPSFVSKITKELKISVSPLETLLKNKIIKIDNVKTQYDFKNILIDTNYIAPCLNKEQENAVYNILNAEEHRPFLLFGITGSGKTEVYIKVIDEIISQNKQAIVLVPEISLTPLMVGRFKSRFGTQVGVTHSKMSAGERHEIWKMAKSGEISIVIGPRSAVFMPFEKIGVIIIDEEHESSYCSESTPKYNAIEVAEERCRICKAKLLLGSATPSMESYFKAENKDYNILRLTNRAGEGVLPKTYIVDMRKELAEGNRTIFSRKLYYAIKEKLDKKEQIMLFLNRRGYSTFVSCRKCGYVMTCSNCSVSYRYHFSENMLMCHYCGKKINIPNVCPSCGSNYIKYFGVGTQKIEMEVKKFFPKANVLRMDFDTVSKKDSHTEILNSFAKGEADILIGTQMIAKGHDFENVSLVGIVAADISLNTGGYRSSEITFELITQAAGRAGRGAIGGEVIIQTYTPDNYAITCAAKQNYDDFYKKESIIRKSMDYPPFGLAFTILFSGENENSVIKKAEEFNIILNKIKVGFEGIDIIGPSEAEVYKIKNKYRIKFIIKCKYDNTIRCFINESLNEYKCKYKSRGVMLDLYTSVRNIF